MVQRRPARATAIEVTLSRTYVELTDLGLRFASEIGFPDTRVGNP
jgi:hypothetical protein